MDILAQYEKENPEQQDRQEMGENPSQDYGQITRWIMKISGDKVRDVRQANMILMGMAIIMIITSLILLFGLPGFSIPTVPLLRSAHPDIIIN